MESIKAQIRQFILKTFLFGQDDGLTDDASFMEQGIIDSTGVLELVAFLEQTFKVKVQDNEISVENLDSIEAVARFLLGKGVILAA